MVFLSVGVIVTFILMIAAIAIAVGLFFLIKYFINYNARVNQKKTQQDEIDKMKIDDL